MKCNIFQLHKEQIMKKLFASVLLALSFSSANAVVIDFESGLNPLFNYAGVDYGTPLPNSGYQTVTDFTGSTFIAFNPFEVSPSTFTWAGGGTFTLNSFVIAGAWGSQTLTIEGLLNGIVQYSSLLAVDNLNVDIFSPNWSGIDAFRISIGNDYIHDPNTSGGGQHWALDNLSVNETPEPESLALMALALVAIAAARKKHAA